MERFIIFSDPHIHNFTRWDNNGSRLDYGIKAVEKVLEYAEEVEASAVLCPGDWIHKPVNVSAKVAVALTDLIARHPDINILTIKGNHDLAAQTTPDGGGLSFIDSLTHFDHFINIGFEQILFSGDSGCYVFGIPYFEHLEDFYKALSLVSASADVIRMDDKDAVLLLMTHVMTPIGTVVEGVDVEHPLFKPFNFILNGHIHESGWLSDKFLNCGSLMSDGTITEAGMEKYFWDLCIHDIGVRITPIPIGDEFPRTVKVLQGEKPERDFDFVHYVLPEVVEADNTNQDTDVHLGQSENESILNYADKVGATTEQKEFIERNIL